MPATKNSPIVNGLNTEALHELVSRIEQNHAEGIAKFQVNTRWVGGAQSETHVANWSLGGRSHPRNFTIRIDEPPELLGSNTQANPQEYLMAAINACLMATYVASCALMGIELESLSIETAGELDLRGFLGLDLNVKPGYDELHYTIRVKGNGTPEQFRKAHEAVQATSPNFWNIAQPVAVRPTLIVE